MCVAVEEELPEWERYVVKYYVGYGTGVDRLRIAIQGRVTTRSLAIALTKSVDELVDPKGIAQDKRDAKGFGPGCPTRVDVRRGSDVQTAMRLIAQC